MITFSLFLMMASAFAIDFPIGQISPLTTNSSEFEKRFFELQKFHLKNQQANSYFGHQLFYNKSPRVSKGPLDIKIKLLESYALAKLCHFDKSIEILKSLSILDTYSSDDQTYFYLVRDFVLLKRNLEIKQGWKPTERITSKKNIRWHLAESMFKRLNSPQKLKVKVEDLCQH